MSQRPDIWRGGEHRDVAAAATRAILKAAKWVQANPVTAAHISVDGKFVAVNVDLDAVALSKLQYIPSVTGGRNAVMTAATEMKKAGMLDPSTDVAALVKQVEPSVVAIYGGGRTASSGTSISWPSLTIRAVGGDKDNSSRMALPVRRRARSSRT